ncbi:MAG: TetR family transcriptional regulator [Actinobacteria bacterium]|nr:TetR family transcriptional regulator [Actinomycetota bacterium]
MESTQPAKKPRGRVRRDDGRRDLSRDEILEVAARLFREKGYRATSLEEVADHFGVKRPAIYYYFRNKAEILGEIHDRFLDELVRQLDEIAAGEESADRKLARIIAGQVRLFADNIAELAVFLGNESELPPRARRSAQARKRLYQEKLEAIFRAGVAEGRLKDLDPHVAMFTVIGMTNWMYRWYRPSGEATPDQIADVIAEIAQSGYLAR